jgi:hypothetical protein
MGSFSTEMEEMEFNTSEDKTVASVSKSTKSTSLLKPIFSTGTDTIAVPDDESPVPIRDEESPPKPSVVSSPNKTQEGKEEQQKSKFDKEEVIQKKKKKSVVLKVGKHSSSLLKTQQKKLIVGGHPKESSTSRQQQPKRRPAALNKSTFIIKKKKKHQHPLFKSGIAPPQVKKRRLPPPPASVPWTLKGRPFSQMMQKRLGNSPTTTTVKEGEGSSAALHYKKGMKGLEELLLSKDDCSSTASTARLPQVFHSVLDKLSTVPLKKANVCWEERVKKLMLKKKKKLKEEEEEGTVWPLATVLEEEEEERSRINEEDMNAYETLLGLGSTSNKGGKQVEFPQEVNEFGQFYVNIVEAEMKLVAKEQQQRKKRGDDEGGQSETTKMKTVRAKVIPVEVEGEEEESGLVLSMERFSELLLVS